MTDPQTSRFDTVWERVDPVPGWLTRDQAEVLHNAVATLRPGSLVVEIGSHHGRSTLVLASREDIQVTAVDPFVDGRMFGGQATRRAFEARVTQAGCGERVRLVPERSRDLRPRWTDPVDLLYVDGKHDYWTVSDDLRWADLLPPGGTVLLHDCFSSIGVTTAVLRHVLPGRTLAYVGRTGSLAEFRRTTPTGADRLAMVRELPWWVRNVGIKVILRLRLHPVARALGHVGAADPY